MQRIAVIKIWHNHGMYLLNLAIRAAVGYPGIFLLSWYPK